jgi:formylglycine-generating enzyme required for sulfatase activity
MANLFMRQSLSSMSLHPKQVILILIGTVLVGSCRNQVASLDPTSNPATETELATTSTEIANQSTATITQAQCEADDKFAYIPNGEFISGSDRQERDYGYRISAEAVVIDKNEPAKIAAAEQRLRGNRWFENEPPLSTDLESFCIAKNLVTNAEYQEFVWQPGIDRQASQRRNIKPRVFWCIPMQK